MLSTKLHEAINAQINAELWSAYLYLAMSLDAEAKGLKGVANWFYVQFQEEQDHARIFMNYLNSRDAKVTLLPLAEVPSEWDSTLSMFVQTLEHEKKVTALINELAFIKRSQISGILTRESGFRVICLPRPDFPDISSVRIIHIYNLDLISSADSNISILDRRA